MGSASYPNTVGHGELLARQGTPALRRQCCPGVTGTLKGEGGDYQMQRLNKNGVMGKCKACFFPGKQWYMQSALGLSQAVSWVHTES